MHLFPESKDAVVVTETPEVFQLFGSLLLNEDLIKVCSEILFSIFLHN